MQCIITEKQYDFGRCIRRSILVMFVRKWFYSISHEIDTIGWIFDHLSCTYMHICVNVGMPLMHGVSLA